MGCSRSIPMPANDLAPSDSRFPQPSAPLAEQISDDMLKEQEVRFPASETDAVARPTSKRSQAVSNPTTSQHSQAVVSQPQASFLPIFPDNLTEATTYIVCKKIWDWTGDEYNVRDHNGRTAYLLEDMGSRIYIKSPQGQRLALLEHKMRRYANTYTIWTFSPNVDGQKPEINEENGTMYLFGEVTSNYLRMCPKVSYSVVTGTGKSKTEVATGNVHVSAIGLEAIVNSTLLEKPIAEIKQTSLFQWQGAHEYCLQLKAGTHPVAMLLVAIAMEHVHEMFSVLNETIKTSLSL